MTDLAYKIRQLRIDHDLKQRQLADTLSVSQNAIFNWENGKRTPAPEMIKRIADYFQVSPSYLMGWDKELKKTTHFFDYLELLGYEINESPYNDKWEITIKESGEKIYISSTEMNLLESSTKENIYLRIFNYLHDEKHKQ